LLELPYRRDFPARTSRKGGGPSGQSRTDGRVSRGSQQTRAGRQLNGAEL